MLISTEIRFCYGPISETELRRFHSFFIYFGQMVSAKVVTMVGYIRGLSFFKKNLIISFMSPIFQLNVKLWTFQSITTYGLSSSC